MRVQNDRNWSLDRVNNKLYKFHESIYIKDSTWQMAYRFLYGTEDSNFIYVKSTGVYKLNHGNESFVDY